MVTALHATNVLRTTGAVVPIEDYRAACALYDEARAEIDRLSLLLADRLPDLVVIDDLTIDLRTGAFIRDGKVIGKLSPAETQLVRCLAANRGRPVSHDDIDAYIWPEIKRDSGHRVRVNLCRIRAKLGDSSHAISGNVFESRYFRTFCNVGVALR